MGGQVTPVRHALVADLHGKRGAWKRVTADAARARADRIVCLGDYLECKVPRRRHDPTRRWPFDDVVDEAPKLWRALAGIELVLGNQETRIRELLRPDQVPDALAPLLAAPERAAIGPGRGEHGHRITWRPAPDGTLLPVFSQVFPEPVRFAGHSHQALLFAVSSPPGSSGVTDREDDLARLRPVPNPVGRPVPVPPDGHLFANLGQARGHPSHWLLYDDDRGELTYHETDG